MEFLELKKGDKVVYLGSMPYKLSNGQEVEKEGDEMFISSDVNVQNKFFRKVEVKVEAKKEIVEDKKEDKPAIKKNNKK